MLDDSVDNTQMDNSHMSMMERRPWARRLNRRLPLRFRDQLPQALPCLPPPQSMAPSTVHSPGQSETPSSNTHLGLLRNPLPRIFTTGRNILGLFRRYYATRLPSHNSEEHNLLDELSDIPSQSTLVNLAPPTFYPYPNRNSFRLGDWYWNGGVQKSQSSFKELVDIVGDPDFCSADIRNVNWNAINHTLAHNDQDEWLEEDAGWMNTPVTISVPYQPRRGAPLDPNRGPRNFTVTDFYYRSLVSVIREKIASPSCNPHFHHEPYELNWQPGEASGIARVYGELYTSPAFIDAHRELQNAPAEPDCDLPRVVVALMFWSDVTQLTSFSNAKLWPLYLFFGNESKYHRCKPSCQLCQHVAYFQKVSCGYIHN
jgi:hypothetical protein